MEILTILGAVGFRLLECAVTSYKRLGKWDWVDIVKEFFVIG